MQAFLKNMPIFIWSIGYFHQLRNDKEFSHIKNHIE